MDPVYLPPELYKRPASPNRRLDEVSAQFESLLIKELLKSASCKLFTDSSSADNNVELYYDQLAREIAKADALGITKLLVASLSRVEDDARC